MIIDLKNGFIEIQDSDDIRSAVTDNKYINIILKNGKSFVVCCSDILEAQETVQKIKEIKLHKNELSYYKIGNIKHSDNPALNIPVAVSKSDITLEIEQ